VFGVDRTLEVIFETNQQYRKLLEAKAESEARLGYWLSQKAKME
jgi:hypothetical protein